MNGLQAFFLTICYELAIVLVFHTHRYVWPTIPYAAFRVITFSIWVVLLTLAMFPLGMWESFFFFRDPRFSLFSIWATVFFFLGPLVQRYLDPPGVPSSPFVIAKSLMFSPFGEEFIYRSFTCILWERAGLSRAFTVFFSPMLFGLSHFHHFFLSIGDRRERLYGAIGQCGFTTVFGWWVAFLWCRSHSFLTIALIHVFCNFMQFPDFDGAITWSHPGQRMCMCGAYVVGLAGFIVAVVALARSPAEWLFDTWAVKALGFHTQ